MVVRGPYRPGEIWRGVPLPPGIPFQQFDNHQIDDEEWSGALGRAAGRLASRGITIRGRARSRFAFAYSLGDLTCSTSVLTGPGAISRRPFEPERGMTA